MKRGRALGDEVDEVSLRELHVEEVVAEHAVQERHREVDRADAAIAGQGRRADREVAQSVRTAHALPAVEVAHA